VGVDRIIRVGVKNKDTNRKTKGEDNPLCYIDAETRKLREQLGLETPVVLG